jgi:hypothetical protein
LYLKRRFRLQRQKDGFEAIEISFSEIAVPSCPDTIESQILFFCADLTSWGLSHDSESMLVFL